VGKSNTDPARSKRQLEEARTRFYRRVKANLCAARLSTIFWKENCGRTIWLTSSMTDHATDRETTIG
jgi:hypothetical protein